jgi:hypothetical protein
VLIVVLLLATLTALAWPGFSQARRSEELGESARRVKTLVQMCRARAMNESRRYRVTIRTDGSLKITRQRDPILAPHEYYRFRDSWANMPFLLEHVWVAAVLPLPEGPPPILVEDELVEFEDFDDEEPIAVAELEYELELDFEPDGTGSSALWVLRDEDGRGLEMTLDGRLGRIRSEPVERLDPDNVERPEPLEDRDEDQEYEEDQGELEERR